MNMKAIHRLFKTLTLFAALVLGPPLVSQEETDEALRLSLERQGDSLTARVFLDLDVGGVQGFSFALCHSTADLQLLETEEGPGLLTANGGAPADFISIKKGAAGTFVSMGVVVSFTAATTMGPGSHEVLIVRYSVRPGGGGASLQFCTAGSPPISTTLVIGGETYAPRTLIPGNTLQADDVEAEGASALVPVFVTTDQPGLTGATLVLCHDPAVVGFAGVQIAPDLGPYSPSLSTPVETANGFQVSLTLGAPVPKVSGLRGLLVRYDAVALGSSPIDFCKAGGTDSVLRFGGATYRPAMDPGSVTVPAEADRGAYRIPEVGAAIDADMVPVVIEGEFPALQDTKGLEVTVAYDSDLLEVVDEASAEAHRGEDLAAFLGANPPLAEAKRVEGGTFHYSVELPDGVFFPQGETWSLVTFRLARKDVSVPGGKTGKLGGARLSLELREVTIGPDVLSNTFVTGGDETVEPFLKSGGITFGERGQVRFAASSIGIEAIEPGTVSIYIDSTSPGVEAFTYSVSHNSGVVAMTQTRTAPDLQGLGPVTSSFSSRPDGFTHTVVLDPQSLLGPVQGFELARVTYDPVGAMGPLGAAGDKTGVVFGPPDPRNPQVALSAGGATYGLTAEGSIDGEVWIKEDPNLLAYKVSNGQGPPGGTGNVAILADVGFSTIAGLQGAVCHDPSMAIFPDIEYGSVLETINNGRPPDFGGWSERANEQGQTGMVFGVVFNLLAGPVYLPVGRDLELLLVTYDLIGRYGDEMPVEFCELGDNGPLGAFIRNIVSRVTMTDVISIPVLNLQGGSILLGDDLAEAFAPESVSGDLGLASVTEYGWLWGVSPDSQTMRHFRRDGSSYGPNIDVGGVPRRIANGGEGWGWASIPGAVSILRFDALEQEVPVGGEPWGIAVDASRNAWVAVAGAEGELLQISRDGRILRRVPLGVERSEPRDLAIDREGGIWVTYGGLNYVSRVGPDGSLAQPVAARLESFRAGGIVTDGRGTVWVSDAGDQSLLAFDLEGRLIRRVAVDGEPTDVSVDGTGALWTVLKINRAGGTDDLSRVTLGADDATLERLSASRVYHGDRTGLLSLRFFVPGEDNDGDGIANLLEVREGTDPLDAGDPPAEENVPPVEDLSGSVLSFRITPSGGGGGGQIGSTNTAGVSWSNVVDYESHSVTVNDRLVKPDLPGDLSSVELGDLPPGPSRITVRSSRAGASSLEVTTTVLVGPGTETKRVPIPDIDPSGIAVDPTQERVFILDGGRNEVAVLDQDLKRKPSGIAVPDPLGSSPTGLSGLAFLPGGDGGNGSLVVLDGEGGRYQEFSLSGASLGGPWDIPFSAPGGEVSYAGLTAGMHEGEPSLFTIARGPQNDDIIIAFQRGGETPPAEFAHPLRTGQVRQFAVGGLDYYAGSGGGAERLLFATGLAGEVQARMVMELSLSGDGSRGAVLLPVFEEPEGSPQVRGMAISGARRRLYAVTSDRVLHVLSDLGTIDNPGRAMEILRVMVGDQEPAVGPVSGGTMVTIEGRNLGGDMQDLRVSFGGNWGTNVSLESGGGVDRLVVETPPGDGPGSVPVFLYSTQTIAFVDGGYTYCDGTGADCNGDGIDDGCQLEGNDCNGNGILDGCEIADRTVEDRDGNGVPDRCESPFFIRGDADGDGRFGLADALTVLHWMFAVPGSRAICAKAADFDDDGKLELADPLGILTYIFVPGSDAPAAPYPECGTDTTRDVLGCDLPTVICQ